MSKDQVYVVGIRHFDQKDYDHKIDILRDMLMEYEFVTDVLDYEAPDDDHECEHKWRDYDKIGVVCKNCGESAPEEIAKGMRSDN